MEERGGKNTMLLTVIAVATLLVAVVGATFAYFSLSTSVDSGTSSAQVETGNPGTVTVKGNGKKLYLKVNAADMSETNKTKTYYAISENESSPSYEDLESTDSIKADTEKKYEIANITLAGAAENTKYTCEYKITVSAEEDLKGLTANDLVLKIYSGDTAEEASTLVKSVDLNTITGENPYKTEVTGTFDLTSTSTTKYLVASLSLLNSGINQADTLANKDLTITINTAGDGNQCTVTSTAGA